MTREEVLRHLSHLPEIKRTSFSDHELDTLARLMEACQTTGQPQVDIQRLETGKAHLYSITVVAVDWAGLLDAVAGVIHERGHNLQYLTALVAKDGKIAAISMLMRLTPAEARRLDQDRGELISLLRMAARGGMSIRKMIKIGASKIRVYSAVIDELSRMATEEEFQDITRPEGEMENFITTRSEAYLTERFPRDLAELILTQHRFQKQVKESRRVMVKVSNLKTTKEHLTGVSVAGLDEFLSLDAVLEAIREFMPDYKRKYDKEFVTEDGVSVIRVEITDPDYKPLSPEACLSLENFLRGRLKESKIKRRDLRLKSGSELIGRILVPRLIEETDATSRPQLLILPEGMEEGVVQFRMVLVNRGQDFSEDIRRSLDDVEGIVVSGLSVNTARDKRVCLFTLFVDSSYFESEETIYNAIKGSVLEFLPDARDFDEGMRRMGVEQFRKVSELIVDRGVSQRFAKRVFYSMSDAYRVTTRVEDLAEEIVFVNDLFVRFLTGGKVIADYISEENHYVFGVVGPSGSLSLEPFVEMFRDHDPIFTGLEILGTNIYLFKIRKTRAVKPRNLLKEIRQKEALR